MHIWRTPPVFDNGMIFSITRKNYERMHKEHEKGEWHEPCSKCTIVCKWNLGFKKCGMSHWSCCYATSFYSECFLKK